MMINIFGNNRSSGPPGPPEPSGKDAFDLIKWAPEAVRRIFRESESVNIYFNTPTDGIIFKGDKPVGLKNHGREDNAQFIGQDFPKIVRIKRDKYMIELKDSIFKIGFIQSATTPPSTAIFVLSFKSLSISKEPRILFSNETGTRAISLTDKNFDGSYAGVLKIYSSGVEEEILFNRQEWAALLIQYTSIENRVYCQYILNETKGTLDVGIEDTKESSALYIDGHPDKISAHHAVGSFELYYVEGEGYELSEKMQKCLIQGVLERVDEE